MTAAAIPGRHVATHPGWLTRRWAKTRAGLREFDDWRQVLTLRIVVPLILAVVSSYYLFRWAHANAMPIALAWTLPAALDVTAYKAVMVARHARDTWARLKASALAWLCVVLSVAGNIGAHALEARDPAGRPLLEVSMWTISATAAVYPLMLVCGHIVSGGMTRRPLRPAEVDAVAARLAVLSTLGRLTDEVRAVSAERDRLVAERDADQAARERAAHDRRVADEAARRERERVAREQAEHDRRERQPAKPARKTPPAPPAGESKVQRIHRLWFEHWARGESPAATVIDDLAEAKDYARRERAKLLKAGWGPGRVPDEYRTETPGGTPTETAPERQGETTAETSETPTVNGRPLALAAG